MGHPPLTTHLPITTNSGTFIQLCFYCIHPYHILCFGEQLLHCLLETVIFF